MIRILIGLLLCLSAITANASITASYCESSTETYAENYYLKDVRYGKLRVKAKSVTIRRLVTTSVVDGQRYKTEAQAHITYVGSTGGESSEVRYFEAVIEDGDPRPSFLYFKEIKEKK